MTGQRLLLSAKESVSEAGLRQRCGLPDAQGGLPSNVPHVDFGKPEMLAQLQDKGASASASASACVVKVRNAFCDQLEALSYAVPAAVVQGQEAEA